MCLQANVITNTSLCIYDTVLFNYGINTTDHTHSSAVSPLRNDTRVCAELFQILNIHSLPTPRDRRMLPEKEQSRASVSKDRWLCREN